MTAGVRVSFHESVSKLIEKYTPAALHIETQVTVYLDKIEEAQELIRRPTAYASTQILRADDDLRDRVVGIVSSVIRAHVSSPFEAKAAAANTLSANIAPYKNIQRHQYQQETVEIDGLCRVLDEYAEEVATLHLEEEVAALKEANESFKTKFEAKAEEEKARQGNKEVDTYKKLGEVREAYDQIVQVVNAYAVVEPSDELAGFIADQPLCQHGRRHLVGRGGHRQGTDRRGAGTGDALRADRPRGAGRGRRGRLAGRDLALRAEEKD